MRSRRMLAIFLAAGLLAVAFGAASTTPARELPIGAVAPDFNLKGTDGEMHSLTGHTGDRGTAVIFTCNQCPFSMGYEDRLIDLARTYQPRGIGFIAINSNDPGIVPGDGFEFMVKRAAEKEFPFPYVVDRSQAIAAAYGARVTPHIFLLDADGRLAYRGRIDDSLKEEEVTSRDFRAALAALVRGTQVPVAETRAFGCSIKWAKKGA